MAHAADPDESGEGPQNGPAHKFFANWQLPPQDGLYMRWDPERSWGADHLVSTLQVVAERLALEMPLADPIMVGDISRRGGGPLPPHKTHNLGIDADIGLFMDDGRQPLGGFVDVPPQRLDCHSTWILIRSFIDTGQFQFGLMDQSLIDTLRTYVANNIGLDPASVDSIFPPPSRRLTWSVRNVLRHAPNHKNHVHVRLVPPEFDDELPPPMGSASIGPIASMTEADIY